MPLVEHISHVSMLPSTTVQLKPRAPAVTAEPHRVKAAQRIIAKRLGDAKPKAMTADESWCAVLDRCASDFGKRPGLKRYLAAVEEGRKRKRRPPIWLYHRRGVKRLGMTFVFERGEFHLADSHRGLLVALQLDEGTGARLAVPGGEALDDLHITLCYCQDVEELGQQGVQRAIDTVTALVVDQPPLEGRVGGIGRFLASETSDGEDVVFAIADVPTLSAFRERLAAALAAVGIVPREDHGYVPHITLSYLPSGTASPVETVPEVPLRFADVVITAGSAWYLVPFGG